MIAAVIFIYSVHLYLHFLPFFSFLISSATNLPYF